MIDIKFTISVPAELAHKMTMLPNHMVDLSELFKDQKAYVTHATFYDIGRSTKHGETNMIIPGLLKRKIE